MIKLTEKEIKDLEALWDGTLEEPSKAAIFARMEEDVEFKRAAEAWKYTITQGFGPTPEENDKAQEIKQYLQSLEKQWKDASTASEKSNSRRYWISAAAAAILLLLWLVPWREIFQPTNELRAFFQVPTRFEANLGDDRSPGERAYDEGNYEEALPLLRAEAAAKNDNLLLFYSGIAAMATDEPVRAINDIEAALADPELVLYQEDFSWYLAQAYAQAGQIDESEVVLKRIKNEGKKYKTKSAELLKILTD